MPVDDHAAELSGLAILVVEDEYLIATALAQALAESHATVLGPASSESRARAILRQDPVVDCAILDIDLGGHQAWSLVDDLVAAGVVVVLATGHGEAAIPERHRLLPRSGKPVELRTVAKVLRHRTAPR
jgi:DNA-binding NtrC family response regulator